LNAAERVANPLQVANLPHNTSRWIEMLLAVIAIAAMADWVPARWFSHDPATLRLVESTPINCLLLERELWSQPFADAAAARGIVTLVLDGDSATGSGGKPVIAFTTRSAMRLDDPVSATTQGVWPGIRPEDPTVHAAPSGAPWIDTNTGFLRYARVSTNASAWIANRVPPERPQPVARYLAAIGDAGMTGARWVLDFDRDFARRLEAGDRRALDDWARIVEHVKFYETHREWRAYVARSTLALVEGPASGALLSGGILDMIATKHTPVIPVPSGKFDAPSLVRSKMAVNADPESLDARHKEILKAFTRAGGTLLTGPPGWQFPALRPDQIALDKGDLDKLDEIWKELNSLTGRKNLGARLFNVSSMLSNLTESPDGKQVVLHLVNYSDYPVENITVHVLGTFRKATLVRPGAAPKALEIYPVEEGTGVDIPQVGALGAVVLEL
jgi:hypothetical protein